MNDTSAKFTQAEEQVQILADYFGVPAPTIKIRKRQGATYYAGQQLIALGANNVYRTTDESICHEFAHHLTRMKEGPTQYKLTENERTGRTRFQREIAPHGKEFFENLLAVVKVWFTNVNDYRWNTEYPRIQQWKGVK